MLDPSTQFCHNPECPARGRVGEGDVVIHSKKEHRYQCRVCGLTFAATKGTPFYRLHEAASLTVVVLTLLCHGCPVQAIVAAFGLDERTVAGWQAKGGQHCQAVHEHIVQQGRVDLGHVQADEILGEDGGKEGLDGDGPGGALSALAGRGRERPPRRGAHHQGGEDRPILCGQPGRPDLCGWTCRLRDCLPERVP